MNKDLKKQTEQKEEECDHFDEEGYPMFYPIGLSEGAMYPAESWLVLECAEDMGGCGKKWAVPFEEFD